LLADRGPARAEDDEAGAEVKAVDVRGAEESVDRLAAPVDERQDDARSLRRLRVDQRVGREVHDVAVRECVARHRSSAGIEVERLERGAARHAKDRLRLGTGPWEAG